MAARPTARSTVGGRFAAAMELYVGWEGGGVGCRGACVTGGFSSWEDKVFNRSCVVSREGDMRFNAFWHSSTDENSVSAVCWILSAVVLKS